MIFIKNNYLKIFITFWLIVGIPYLMYRGYKYNLESSKIFFESDVVGKITDIRDGSGGYEVIELGSGKVYRFFSLDFDKYVTIGDSIYKPAHEDTIIIYKEKEQKMKFTFLKPQEIKFIGLDKTK
jgi:hypothetical protein